MNSIEKTLKYYELLMAIDNLENLVYNSSLKEGYEYSFYRDESDKKEWAKIHVSSGEFASYKRALDYFDIFHKEFEKEINKRCFFIEYKGEKIASATISPADEYGYKCVVDWLAIKKEYQGRGLARPLIYKCLNIAKELGYNSILLHTQTHTWLAAKLYLDVGFNPLILEDLTGWKILKTLTNHQKLENIESIDEDDMYDSLSLNVVKNLNSIHKNYSYEIWYIDDLNDVYVREDNCFYHYKFSNNGSNISLSEKYVDDN